MSTTTVLARTYELSYIYQSGGWYCFIRNGAYTEKERIVLINALMDAQVEELNRRLPQGCYWLPRLGEIHGPANVNLGDINLDLALRAAADTVAARFQEIEARVLGSGA